VDVSIGSAEATDVSARSEAKNDAVVNRMIAVFCVVTCMLCPGLCSEIDSALGPLRVNEGLDGRENVAAAQRNAV
jgi:hypothetical protein